MENVYKIAIIGGTGKVGRYIANEALQKGYQVRMLVRNPERLVLKDDRIEVVQGDIQNIENIRTLLTDCQIVINTFGQPIKDIPLYSSITEKILEVMKELKINRYIGVTGASLNIHGDKREFSSKVIAMLFKIFYSKAMKDKQKEWSILNKNILIEWTLIRLPMVVDSSEIGYVKENLTDMPGMKITNRDIATFIINQIKNQKYVHKVPFISN